MVLGMGLLGFYDNPVFSDLTVVLPSCKRLKCHQIILAACSRKFAAILASGGFQVLLHVLGTHAVHG